MNILILIEFRINSENVGVTANAVDGDFRGFLHYVAQGACQLELARTVHDSDLDREQLASDGSPRKTVDNAYFVLLADGVGQIFLVAEERLDFLFVDFKCFNAVLELLYRAFAENRSDRALESTHARFPCIEINQIVDTLLCELDLSCGEAAKIELLRNKVLFRDMELLLAGVAVYLDDFHSVPERRGNGSEVVRCGDKHNV